MNFFGATMTPLEQLRLNASGKTLTDLDITGIIGRSETEDLREMYFPNSKPIVAMGSDIRLPAGFRVVHAADKFEYEVIAALAPRNVVVRIAIQGGSRATGAGLDS